MEVKPTYQEKVQVMGFRNDADEEYVIFTKEMPADIEDYKIKGYRVEFNYLINDNLPYNFPYEIELHKRI